MKRETHIFQRSQVERVITMAECVSLVEKAFALYGEGNVEMPPKIYLSFPRGDLRCMPAYVPAWNIAGMKNVSVHPENADVPAVMATISLFDPETGFPLAIMDGTFITMMRTGAAGGVAARHLAREDARAAAFIGAGIQAEAQLEALKVTRPGISRVTVYDLKGERMKAFAAAAAARHGLETSPAASVEEAVKGADVVVTTTPARSPVVRSEFVRPGTHINAIGADARGKQELDPAILTRAKVVVDSWEQASKSGEINVSVAGGMIGPGDLHGDIGEVVTGKKPGRESPDEITVFDSTGLAIQDVAVAYEVYRRLAAQERPGPGVRKVNFLG